MTTTTAEMPLRRNRDFRRLWVGQALSALGDNMTAVALPLVALALTGSATRAGLVNLAAMVPLAALQLPAGILVDRLNRRAVLVLADLGRGLGVASVAVALAAGHLTYAQLLVVAALDGTLSVGYMIAERTVLPDLVPAEGQLSDAVALNQGRTYGAMLAGRPLGGALYAVRRALPFVADAVSYLASLGAVLAIRTPLTAPPREEERGSVGRDLLVGLRWFAGQRFVRTAALLVAGSDFVINALYLLLVVVARDHGAPAGMVGVMLALGGAGGMLGALCAPLARRRIRSLRLVVAGVAWVATALVALIALSTDAIVLGVLLGLVLSVWPLYNAVIVARVMTMIPAELRGRVQSALLTVAIVPSVFAQALAGLALDTIGRLPTVACCVALLLVISVVGTASRSVREAS